MALSATANGRSLVSQTRHLTLISQWLGHKQFTTTLVYAHADTETKRKAIGGTSPIEQISQATYKVEDEETLKRLYGLK